MESVYEDHLKKKVIDRTSHRTAVLAVDINILRHV